MSHSGVVFACSSVLAWSWNDSGTDPGVSVPLPNIRITCHITPQLSLGSSSKVPLSAMPDCNRKALLGWQPTPANNYFHFVVRTQLHSGNHKVLEIGSCHTALSSYWVSRRHRKPIFVGTEFPKFADLKWFLQKSSGRIFRTTSPNCNPSPCDAQIDNEQVVQMAFPEPVSLPGVSGVSSERASCRLQHIVSCWCDDACTVHVVVLARSTGP